jgi:hypothetical protein
MIPVPLQPEEIKGIENLRRLGMLLFGVLSVKC